MLLLRVTILSILTLTLVAAGCKCPSGCCIPATPRAPCVYDLAIPDAAPPDLMRLVPDCVSESCDLAPLPAPSESYQLIDAAVCQCNAATNTAHANLVELERHWAQVVIECDSKYVARNLCLNRDLLALHATDLRNKAAIAALEAFYQLAGLEARRHFLDLAIEETRQTLQRVRQLDRSSLDFEEEFDEGSIVAKLHDLEDSRLQLDFARVQLNGQLQKLVGCQLNEQEFLWPNVDWTPDLAPLDIPAELAEGLATRIDLRGIELVLCNLEKQTLRVARGVLGVADAALGSVEPTEGWVHRLRCIRCNDHEVGVRCRQLAGLRAEHEQLATADIKSAAYEVILQQQRVALARQYVQDQRETLYELTAKQEVDDATVFEASRAKGALYDAESDLIQQVAALKIARARLKAAKGELVVECGFSPTLCTEGCCNGECMRCKWPTCTCPQEPCGRCSCLK